MFLPLSSLLQNATHRANVTQGVTVSLALERVNSTLARALGQMRKARARAAYIKYRTLTISVSDASIAAMLGSHEKEILDTLNQGCVKPLAERIQVILEIPKQEG
ncbi:DUF721 domain-containing protein [Candidatus Uhrbacteria bacterium]|nr:DUF721 domain-containing protein [Candidatus Uhrbacteria bacterium]